jgi:peptidoglycan/xylan/chitin deacetylase (PgdA/CDA1 family)
LPAARRRLVLFDRHHLDWTVDPIRWRIRLPPQILRAASAALPRPPLHLFLDGTPDVLRTRKSEVSDQELSRQSQAYRRLALRTPGAVRLDATRPLGQVAAAALEAVLDRQALRARARLTGSAASVPILCYHGVGIAAPHRRGGKVRWDVGLSRFQRDLEALARAGYQLTSLANYDPTGSRQVVLTLDDGLSTDHQAVWPLLRELGGSATCFVITSKVGQPGYLTRTQLAELALAGWEIAAHSRTHRLMTELTAVEQDDELRGSRQDIEDWLGRKVSVFAFPGGKYTDALLEAALLAGYPQVCSVDWGHARAGLTDFLLPRCMIGPGVYHVCALDVVERRRAYWIRRALLGGRDLLREVMRPAEEER